MPGGLVAGTVIRPTAWRRLFPVELDVEDTAEVLWPAPAELAGTCLYPDFGGYLADAVSARAPPATFRTGAVGGEDGCHLLPVLSEPRAAVPRDRPSGSPMARPVFGALLRTPEK
ncbi:hypothetical protein [Kitasatospora griseola]|uniref:hypothetical protein n=1 Tax=Kitasatospora griseola TaxID=2064 RepID=UPI003829A360